MRLAACLALLTASVWGHAEPLTFLDVRLQLVPPSAAASDVTPFIGILPGAIMGRPTPEPKLPLVSAETVEISFPLYLAEPLYEALSEPLMTNTLTIDPQEARIARVSTGAYSESGDGLGGGFRETDTGLDLILFYVDRPCRMSGFTAVNGKEFSVALSFERPGFHWISIDREGNIRNAESDIPVDYEIYTQSPQPGVTA